MPHFVYLYGMFISGACLTAVLMMRHAMNTQRKAMGNVQQVLTATVIAGANMWDTLTPEQIRSLHPRTVDVANSLPLWSEIQACMDLAREALRDPPNTQQESETQE